MLTTDKGDAFAFDVKKHPDIMYQGLGRLLQSVHVLKVKLIFFTTLSPSRSLSHTHTLHTHTHTHTINAQVDKELTGINVGISYSTLVLFPVNMNILE